MAEVVRKSVAIGIAGLAAVIVAAWRQIQRDNTLETDPVNGGVPSPSTPDAAPPSVDPDSVAETPAPGAASPSALFTPSVSEQSTKAELYEIATDLEIEGRSKMNKAELLAAIRAAS